MREIGSEFWSVPLSDSKNNLFPDDTVWCLSGRNALLIIIDDILAKHSVKTVALPSWCCDSIIVPFKLRGLQVHFYPVVGSFQDLSYVNEDVLLLMDYFGYSGYSHVPSGYTGVVIRDLTHSVFSGISDDADYYFGSLRKWAGFWTGGFAWSRYPSCLHPSVLLSFQRYVELRQTAMEQKEQYMAFVLNDKSYYSSFLEADKLLDDLHVAFSSTPRDEHAASFLDVERIKKRRRLNAQILIDAFPDFCLFNKIGPLDCPLFVPVRFKNRDRIKKIMIEEGIYCPSHWPISPLHSLDSCTKAIYEDEISLVCDQRYGDNEMFRIIDTVKKGL